MAVPFLLACIAYCIFNYEEFPEQDSKPNAELQIKHKVRRWIWFTIEKVN